VRSVPKKTQKNPKDPVQPSPAYRFGPFELRATEHVLTRRGERVALSPKAFDLLRLLVERHGRVVEKRELVDALWPDTFVEEANLSVQVAAVRKALGRRGAPFIETIAKRGYRFVAPVEDVDTAIEAARSRSFRLLVLPLRTLSSNPEIQFLSFSLPDAIAGSLAELPWLIVRAPLAVRAAVSGGEADTLSGSGEVDAVLEGTLGEGASGTRVRMSLVEVPGGTVLFSEEFTVDLPELFELQGRVARRVAGMLAPHAMPHGGARADQSVPSTPGAYVLYLRANQLAYETSQWLKARELYEAALREDPHYAPAWARLARCNRVIGKFAASPDETRESFARAEEAFRRALSLDPTLSLAHSLYAQLEVDLGRAEQAMVRLVNRAHERPHAAELFAGLVHALRFCGLLDWSIAAHERARALDPTLPTSVHHTWWMKGEYGRALRETYGDIGYMPGVALAALGRDRDAIAALRWREREAGDSRAGSYIASLRALLEGDREQSLRALDHACALQVDPEAIYYLARTYARLGCDERAIREMTRVVDGGFVCYETFARDPWLAGLRGHPGFGALLARARTASARAAGAFASAGGRELLE
jgi:eukaryotic-like serine/threonine-protein kinase